ncbi:unannotated protein [freshwater metagenome]|uniref:Unannotated protein n=1 Tax=freshwater metagenome TaxID=449393 RepID=A0A6J6BB36_9ZZZZ|nr:DUF3043 domain-containing protein [Actinomycetota bacterium]MTA05653.1 DUF3043 domain-containing protein [Actinomycetota bacterium]MTA37892.1 DUF3043 domain-containing protein [Actinomycetota bacterium]
MTDSADTSPTTGKGRATPSRKEREAANKRPLVAKRTKTKTTKEDRRKRANERLVARQGYEAGDERYMPARDKGSQRRFVRDFVDARYTIGEFMIPLMFAVIIATFLPQYTATDGSGAVFQLTVLIAMYGFFLTAVADALIFSRKLLRMMTDKFGASNIEKGHRWYASTRAFQFRPLRVPKPQVARGEHPS